MASSKHRDHQMRRQDESFRRALARREQHLAMLDAHDKEKGLVEIRGKRHTRRELLDHPELRRPRTTA